MTGILNSQYLQKSAMNNGEGLIFDRHRPKIKENIMKSSTRDEAEGKIHQAKGKTKEIVGKTFDNPDLEAQGQVENFEGKTQEKVGDVKRSFNK